MAKIRIMKSSVLLEVDGVLFTENGVEFAWHKPKDREHNLEFTHTKSGLGFNGFGAKTASKMMESFNACVDRLGKDKFWAQMDKVRSIEESLQRVKEQEDRNEKNRKGIEELGRVLGMSVGFCRTSLMIGSITIDVIKLDDDLKRKFGKVEYPDDMSTSEFVTKTWGKEVSELIRELIKM